MTTTRTMEIEDKHSPPFFKKFQFPLRVEKECMFGMKTIANTSILLQDGE